MGNEGQIERSGDPSAAAVIQYRPRTPADWTTEPKNLQDAMDETRAAAGGGTSHDLLSTTHDDTTTETPVRGDVIVADASPAWSRLPVGTANQVLTTDGTSVSWQDPAGGGGSNALLDGTAHTDTLAAAVSRGSLIVGNATPAWSELVIGAAARVLRSDGTDASWAQVVLTTDISGVLPIANGGTNSAAALATANAIMISNGSAIVEATMTANGNALGGVRTITADHAGFGVSLFNLNGDRCFLANGNAASVNYLFTTATILTTGSVSLAAAGGDTNVDILLTPAGSGVVRAGGGLALTDGLGLVFGTGSDAAIKYNTGWTNHALAIGVAVGAAATSGYVTICELADIDDNTRAPAGTATDPTLRIWSSDAAEINDYADLYFSAADEQFYIALGQGSIRVSDIQAITATGFACQDEATSTSNPTICPSRSDTATGIGGAVGSVALITAGTSRLTVAAGGDVTIPNNATITGNITIGEDSWIGIGASNCRIQFDSTPAIDEITFVDTKVIQENDGGSSVYRNRCGSDTAGHVPAIQLQRSRGTVASPTACQDLDKCGSIDSAVHDAGGYNFRGSVAFYVDGAVTGSSQPTSLVLETGSTSRTEAARVYPNNRIRIGGSGPISSVGSPGAILHVDQSAAAGVVPVLFLDQADVSQEMIELVSVPGTGDAIEVNAGESMTVTDWVKVTVNGNTRYLQAGTKA